MDSGRVGQGCTAGIVGRRTARGKEVGDAIRAANANALASELEGVAWTNSQLLLQARDFLVRKGMRRPSPSDVERLASMARAELDARAVRG